MLTYTTLKDRPRVSGSDRTDARRVYACAAGGCRGLYHLLSVGQNLARQVRQRQVGGGAKGILAQMGRQVALYSRLSEDQSPANHARLALWAEPTPEQLLVSSLTRLAMRLSRARHGAGTGRQPGPPPVPLMLEGAPAGAGRYRASPTTPDGRLRTNSALQREEESAHG